MYKEECLSVLYAFDRCKSQRSQTLHGIPLPSEEGQEGANALEGAGEGRFPPFSEKLQKIF
jgi:hypothetical protein